VSLHVPNYVSQVPNVFPRAPHIYSTFFAPKFSILPFQKVRFFKIQMLIKKSNNFNYILHGTFAASTLIVLFSEMLENFRICFGKERKISRKRLNLQEYYIC
jgi:hypothetical protein